VSVQAAGTLERAQAALGGKARALPPEGDGVPALAVESVDVADLARALRDRCGFESVTFVTAVDRYPAEPRFEVVHQLASLAHGDRLRLVTRVPAGRAIVPTVTHLWPGAGFMERECFDMFGIRFEGHAGLKRLFMPDEYEHHPLRKDFPHQGIEPDRLYREWDARRRGSTP
jgi:NADH-quinone oxidoreductase subunit C